MTDYAGETVGLRLTVDDDDDLPLTPAPDSVTVQPYNETETAPYTVEQDMALVRIELGVASDGTAQTLTDPLKSWPVDKWAGAVLRITGGTGAGQERRIASNTDHTIIIDPTQVVNGSPIGDLNPAPDATSTYLIHRGLYILNWDTPAELADKTVLFVFRARHAAPNAYLDLEKVALRLASLPNTLRESVSAAQAMRGLATLLTPDYVDGLIDEAADGIRGDLLDECGYDINTQSSIDPTLRIALIKQTRALILHRDASAGLRVSTVQEGGEKLVIEGQKLSDIEGLEADAKHRVKRFCRRATTVFMPSAFVADRPLPREPMAPLNLPPQEQFWVW